jgi:biopolymer transport protein ExbD
MYSAHQVRSKARMAVKRREAVVEQEEIEGGELNLIPYLDIVTNLMLFLLASVSAGILLGQLNTMLPDKAPAGASADQPKPDTKPEDIPLKMVVSVTKEQIILWSVSQREGTLQKPRLVLPRIGLDGSRCDGGYMCETGWCEPGKAVCGPNPDKNQARLPVFDYHQLNKTLYDIAKLHYATPAPKKRAIDTYQAVLMADDSTPYETLISIMGAMRCKMPEVGESTERCYLPSNDEVLTKAENPVDDVSRLYDTARVDYNPDVHALFNDILFSRGFE